MKFNCPRCNSENVYIAAEVPWSTDGLMPKQKIFLKCEDCDFVIPISRIKKQD
jgi:transcription elongation factor Elf1